jgi:hypothetical protein
MLLDLTDVCPLLTKQYIQVGLQLQYMLYNFLMVSPRIHGMVKSFWSSYPWAPALINNRCKSITTDMDITDRAIQVGGAREGQSFVLKV